MFAFLLWTMLGWRAAAAELLVEALICALLYGGGGGRRIRATLRDLVRRPARRTLLPAGPRTPL